MLFSPDGPDTLGGMVSVLATCARSSTASSSVAVLIAGLSVEGVTVATKSLGAAQI